MKNQKLSENQKLVLVSGLLGFVLYVLLLLGRPHVGWCDDVFFADWIYQMAENNSFLSTAWGAKPCYFPLYTLFMVGWVKVFGFSYVSIHIPNILFAFVSYLIIALSLVNYKLIQKKRSVLGFSLCYWFGNSLFWNFNNGRVESLALLIAVVTIYMYVKYISSKKYTSLIAFIFCSFLMGMTAVQGLIVVFVVIFLHFCLTFKESIRKWYVYLLYGVGYGFGFLTTCIFFFFNNGLKRFIKATFVGSPTILNAFVKLANTLSPGAWELDVSTLSTSNLSFIEKVHSLTYNGILMNKENWVILALIILVFIILIIKGKVKGLPIWTKIFSLSTLLLPSLYVVMGRYTLYYTWGVYVISICTLFILLEYVRRDFMLSSLLCASTFVYFWSFPHNKNYVKFDFGKSINAKYASDIECIGVDTTKYTVVPYEWYYFLNETHPKLYFYFHSQPCVEEIICPPKEEKYWREQYEIEEILRTDNYCKFKVVSYKGDIIN